jgi:hypothetical protein
MTRDYLFIQRDAFSVEQGQRGQMLAEIANFDANRLLNTNVDDLVKYLEEKYRVAVPELLEDQMAVDPTEARRDASGDPSRFFLDKDRPFYVTGTQICVEVPFSGDPQLFDIQPHTHNLNPPQGLVRGNILSFSLWGENLNATQVQRQIETWLTSIRQHLQWHCDGFRNLNLGLPLDARDAIEKRRAKLLDSQNLVAALGLPLKRRGDAPITYAAPEVKRKVLPKLPPATAGVFKPEPVLEEAEYQHILTIMESMTHVLERSPTTFYNLDEDAIRTHFLVQLNGQYGGEATGETFNYRGKTDILIRSGGRNIFIAECKFWGGPNKLNETIDQLLGYVSWRDSKTAILLFNRNKHFSKVLASIPEVMMSHPNFQREDGRQGDTRFRYRYRHKDDPQKFCTSPF